MRLAVLLGLLATGVGQGSERPLVLLVGDSTTQGVCAGCAPPPAESPARALQLLRRRLPRTSRWRRMRALSAGVGGSTSRDWLEMRGAICRFVGADAARAGDLGTRALAHACARGIGLAAAVRALVPRPPALVLLVLGANDVMNHVAPEEYVAALGKIAAAFAPATVLVGTPFWSSQPERRDLAALAAAVRRADVLHGPDFYAVHLPLDESGVHLTPGAYAAAAALWLDALPR